MQRSTSLTNIQTFDDWVSVFAWFMKRNLIKQITMFMDLRKLYLSEIYHLVLCNRTFTSNHYHNLYHHMFQNPFSRTSSSKSSVLPGHHHTCSLRENTLTALASVCLMRECCKMARFVYYRYHEDRTVPPVWLLAKRLIDIVLKVVFHFLLGFISVLAVYYKLIYFVCSCSRLTKSLRNKCNKPPSQSKLGDWMCCRGNIKLQLSHCLMVRVNLTPQCTALISGIKTIISYAPAASPFWSPPFPLEAPRCLFHTAPFTTTQIRPHVLKQKQSPACLIILLSASFRWAAVILF